jgi:hypothetical protein
MCQLSADLAVAHLNLVVIPRTVTGRRSGRNKNGAMMTGQTDAHLSLPTSTPEAAMTLAPASTRTSLPIALWIVPVIVLVLAVFPLPYGYYTFTRIVTCLAA